MSNEQKIGKNRGPNRGSLESIGGDLRTPGVVKTPSHLPMIPPKSLKSYLLRNGLETTRGTQIESCPARLGAQDAILQGLGDADAVAAADLVGELQHLQRCLGLAVDRHAASFLEAERNFLNLVGGVLRPSAGVGRDGS